LCKDNKNAGKKRFFMFQKTNENVSQGKKHGYS
jgi:hypothetical protein